MEKILGSLAEDDEQPIGRLYRETFGETLDRRTFDHIVGGLVRAGVVEVRSDRFQKGGEWIEFQRLCLRDGGGSIEAEEPRRFVTLDDEPEPKKKKTGGKGKASKGKGSSKAFWVWKARQKKGRA